MAINLKFLKKTVSSRNCSHTVIKIKPIWKVFDYLVEKGHKAVNVV
jgi:hypothetical protein